MRLYLCEKPDQARVVAAAIGNPAARDGYIEADGGAAVTYCFGHLLEPKYPEEYGEELKAWAWDTLPIIPSPFEFKARDGKAAKQLKIIAGLMKKATSLVVSTDADREGELIAYEVITAFGFKGPIERLWITDLTLPAVRKALANLKPGAETRPLFHAAWARMCADWLVGFNLTRAATLKLRAGPGKPLSIGRVQTPTLGLIVRREREIKNFKPENYYELTAWVDTAGGHKIKMRFAPPEEKRIKDQKLAQAYADKAKGARGPLRVKVEQKSEGPPPLFDLNMLQQQANSRFGWPADHTLAVAQALYEKHNALTYPRSDSKALPSEQSDQAQTIIDHLLNVPDLKAAAPGLQKPLIRDSVYDDSKVKSHHAIVPTAVPANLAAMSDDEKRLYLLVSRHFLAAHMPDHLYLATTVLFDANGVPFTARGRKTTAPGWQAAFAGASGEDGAEGGKEEGAEAEEDDRVQLPPVNDGDPGQAGRVEVDSKTTQPPPRFTEATLIGAMMNIAKFVDDPAAKKRLKQTSGIGTVATRANIIKTLKEREFITVKSRKLLPTDVGMGLITALESVLPDYANAAVTATWEDALEAIAQNQVDRKVFVEAIAKQVRTDVAKMKAAENCVTVGAPGARRDGDRQAPRGPLSKEDYQKRKQEAMDAGIVLKVPFDQRDKVKEMGAIWHPEKKAWVIAPSMDQEPFRKAGYIQ